MNTQELAEYTKRSLALGNWPEGLAHIMERCILELPACNVSMVPCGDHAHMAFIVEAPALPQGMAKLEWIIGMDDGHPGHWSTIDDVRITEWIEMQKSTLQDLARTFVGRSKNTLN